MQERLEMRKTVRSARRTEAGAELLEFALILPVFLTLLIGIFWMSRAFNIYETIARAAREGARAGVAPTCSTCGDTFPTAATVETAVTNSLAGSSMATAGPGITITVQQHQQLNLDPNNPSALWTVVQITYPFQFILPFTRMNMSTVTMTTKAEMVEE